MCILFVLLFSWIVSFWELVDLRWQLPKSIWFDDDDHDDDDDDDDEVPGSTLSVYAERLKFYAKLVSTMQVIANFRETSASEMTYIVSGGALNSTLSLTVNKTFGVKKKPPVTAFYWYSLAS